MGQNTVQSSNALFIEDQIVYVTSYSSAKPNDVLTGLSGASWTNIGALSEFSREAKIETQVPASQNVQHDPFVSKMGETINVSIQELNPDVYNMMMGSAAQSQIIAGSSTATYSTSYPAGTVGTDQFYAFPQQNWSSTSSTLPAAPTSHVLSGSTGAYVNKVDYYIMKNEAGYYGYKLYSTGNHTSTNTLTVNVGYVPKAQDILWHGGADTLTPMAMKVYSVYSDGRALTSYYPYVNYMSGGAIRDKGDGSGEFKDMNFGMEAKEDPNWTYNGRKQFRVDVFTTG
jgi:hypothetical protein